jgi:hypothetical protein
VAEKRPDSFGLLHGKLLRTLPWCYIVVEDMTSTAKLISYGKPLSMKEGILRSAFLLNVMAATLCSVLPGGEVRATRVTHEQGGLTYEYPAD